MGGRGTERTLNGRVNACVAVRLPSLASGFARASGQLRAINGRVGQLLPMGKLILITKLNGVRVAPSSLKPGADQQILTAHRVNKRVTHSAKLSQLHPITMVRAKIAKRANVRANRCVLDVMQQVEPATIITVSTLTSHEARELNYALRVDSAKVSPNTKINGRQAGVAGRAVKIPIVTVKIPAIISTRALTISVLNGSYGQGARGVLVPRNERLMIVPERVSLLARETSELVTFTLGKTLRGRFSLPSLVSLVWVRACLRVFACNATCVCYEGQ